MCLEESAVIVKVLFCFFLRFLFPFPPSQARVVLAKTDIFSSSLLHWWQVKEASFGVHGTGPTYYIQYASTGDIVCWCYFIHTLSKPPTSAIAAVNGEVRVLASSCHLR